MQAITIVGSLDGCSTEFRTGLRSGDINIILHQLMLIANRVGGELHAKFKPAHQLNVHYTYNTYPSVLCMEVVLPSKPEINYKVTLSHGVLESLYYTIKLESYLKSNLKETFAAVVSDASILAIVKRITSSYSSFCKQLSS